MNGIRFIIAERDNRLTTQNSGVYVPGSADTGGIEFYGKLTNVIKLLYRERYTFVLFKCDWFNTNPSRQGSIKHDYHLISFDTNTRWYENDPYILAIQAKQVFYMNDPKLGGGWKVIQSIQHRNVWDIPEKQEFEGDNGDDDVAYLENASFDIPNMGPMQNNNRTLTPYCLDNVPPIEVEIESITVDLGKLPRVDDNESDDEFTLEESDTHSDGGLSTADDDSDLD